MKTITEFDGFLLKRVVEKMAALTTEGKTPEEQQAGLTEAFKVEGDKLKLLMSAVEVAKNKLEGLKRVLVHTFAEGEKVPSHFSEKEGHHFGLEFYPHAAKAKPVREDRFAKGGKRDRGGKKGRDNGRGKPRGERGERPRQSDGEVSASAAAGEKRAPRPPREPRAPKAPRPPKATAAPNGVKISFTDGKPNIQKASNSPSPETQSPSQSSDPATTVSSSS